MGRVSRNLNVLVVDDDPLLAQVLARQLARVGHQPAIAGAVGEAFELIEQQHFDVVLADYRLSDGTGQSLVERAGAACPVIVLTGAAADATVEGAYAVLQKPCAPSMLLDVLERAALRP